MFTNIADISDHVVVDLDTGTILNTNIVLVPKAAVGGEDWTEGSDSEIVAHALTHGRPLVVANN